MAEGLVNLVARGFVAEGFVAEGFVIDVAWGRCFWWRRQPQFCDILVMSIEQG